MAVLDDRTIEIIDSLSPGADQVNLGALMEQALSGVLPPGSVSLAEIENGTDGQVIVGQTGSALLFKALTGDISLTKAGLTAVAALDLETATVTNITTTEILIGTGVGTAAYASLSGDVTMTNGGDVTIGTLDHGLLIQPTVVVDTSTYPLRVQYNYAGATENSGVDMDSYGFRSTITQTTSNDNATLGLRGYLQGMKSDLHIDGFVDDAYGLYGRIYVDGASTANQIYGVNLVLSHGANVITMDETGNYAGVGVSMNGTGDVTCGGTGYGKVSGMYVNWNEENAMTVDTCGFYLGVQSGATLDSGYRVNASGSLTSSFHSYNSSGTPTQALELSGAHTYLCEVPAAGTAPVTAETGTTCAGDGVRIAVKVEGDATVYYLRAATDWT